MGKLDIDIAVVKKLVELVESHNLEELTVQEGDLSVTIKGHTPKAAAVTEQKLSIEDITELEEEMEELIDVSEPSEILAGNIVDIVAPLVGVFYRASSPDVPNFVEVGDTIEIGTEVGLIEAMKVFSPIPSEVAGEVVAIVADNGKLVQQGDLLMKIRISDE